MLVGPDQWSYIGLLVDPYTTLRLTQASQLTAGALPVKALEWALPYLTTGKSLPEPAEVWHEGRCGRCGRALTDPESIARGLGPECWEILGGGV